MENEVTCESRVSSGAGSGEPAYGVCGSLFASHMLPHQKNKRCINWEAGEPAGEAQATTEQDVRIERAYAEVAEHSRTQPHKTVPVQVWTDIDEGLAEIVTYLNTLPGVRTQACCQGTEYGPNPYPAYVMSEWDEDIDERLQSEFEVEYLGKFWGYLRPRSGYAERGVYRPNAAEGQGDEHLPLSSAESWRKRVEALEQENARLRWEGNQFSQMAHRLRELEKIASERAEAAEQELAQVREREQEQEAAFRVLARELGNPTLIADADSSLEMELVKLAVVALRKEREEK